MDMGSVPKPDSESYYCCITKRNHVVLGVRSHMYEFITKN